MSFFKFKNTFELDESFYNYLLSSGQFLLKYQDLNHAINDLNENPENFPKIVFISSECSKKGFVCINCNNNRFEKISSDIKNIIELHNFKNENIKKILNKNKI